MNDTMSLLLATTILSIGGVGLYMYKSDEGQKGGEEEYNEDSLFGSGSFFGSSNETDEHVEVEDDEPAFYEPKVKTRGGKTKRNNRKTSGTKRRYY
jgi:hypothetical protein